MTFQIEIQKLNLESRSFFQNTLFSLPPGVWALCGPRGGGKTVLLSAMAGLVPFEGTVTLCDRRFTSWDAQKANAQGVYMVPRVEALLPSRDVTENLFAGCELKRFFWPDWKAMRAATSELLARFSLDLPPWGVRVGDLSGGQRRMVALLVGLKRARRLLLLDEPLAMLGFGERRALSQLLVDVSALGVTVLMAASNPRDVAPLVQGFWVVEGGALGGFLPPSNQVWW